MENNQSSWFKKNFNKIAYVLLLGVIAILFVNYNDLKSQRAVSNDTPSQNTQPTELAVKEPEKVEEENVPDTVPPRIENYCFSSAFPALKKNEERVCIKIDSWNGYLNSTNSIPITGKIEGEIKSITVDGKKITWDENKQIYQRINLYIYGGLNKYKVVAEDMNGNKSTGYVETDAANTDNDLDVNLNE